MSEQRLLYSDKYVPSIFFWCKSRQDILEQKSGARKTQMKIFFFNLSSWPNRRRLPEKAPTWDNWLSPNAQIRLDGICEQVKLMNGLKSGFNFLTGAAEFRDETHPRLFDSSWLLSKIRNLTRRTFVPPLRKELHKRQLTLSKIVYIAT